MPLGDKIPHSSSGGDEPQELLSRPAEDSAEVDGSEQGGSTLGWIGELVVLGGLAAIIALTVRTWVVQPFTIPSSSMENTLRVGDYVLVNKLVYRFRAPAPGDVVVFDSPDGDDRDYIKRVVAVGGQSVDVRDGAVYVDGVRRVEPYVNAAFPDDYTANGPVEVPRGYVFLMGDNRANSRDSRYFGPQPLGSILGEAFVIYWPWDHAGTL